MVDLSLVKSEHLWYIIGFIAADGNLSSDGRHINITSKDRQFLFQIRDVLGLKIKVGRKARGYLQEKNYSLLQFSDIKFYRFLEKLGLTKNKSLILGRLNIPKRYFKDFLRGVIDGDGCIRQWKHATNNHIQWSLTITSAAPVFSKWLKEEIESQFGIVGKLYNYHHKNKKNPINLLKFGKLATKAILIDIYYNDCFVLDRKLKIVRKCLESKDGWSQFKTLPKFVI